MAWTCGLSELMSVTFVLAITGLWAPISDDLGILCAFYRSRETNFLGTAALSAPSANSGRKGNQKRASTPEGTSGLPLLCFLPSKLSQGPQRTSMCLHLLPSLLTCLVQVPPSGPPHTASLLSGIPATHRGMSLDESPHACLGNWLLLCVSRQLLALDHC